MAEKRPLVLYSGSVQELATGDTLPSNGGTGAANFSYENSTAVVTIPVNQQMIVYQDFEVILDLIIEGTMVLI